MARSAKFIAPAEATLAPLRDKTVAVVGFGAQGRAQALNLRDSGCRVIVGQRGGGPGFEAAVADGFEPLAIEQAARAGDLLILALPDEVLAPVFQRQIRPGLRAGQTLGLLHGFAVHYGQIEAPVGVDVVLVAPKGQGQAVRSEYLAGRGVVALIAVGRDASGGARQTALAWAAGIGSHRAALIETTFREETETDLFGEQAVLCGGLGALIKAGFETLVEAGYPAELAYFECCHEVKLIAELIYEGGLAYMRERISSTARYGDLTRGPRVVGRASRQAMRALLEEIRSGRFARQWLAESASGAATLKELLAREGGHPLERVGRRMRELMRGGGV